MIRIVTSRQILRRSLAILVILTVLHAAYYIIVTSTHEQHGRQLQEVRVLRLRSEHASLPASVFLPSLVSSGTSKAVHSSTVSPAGSQCPSPPDSDEDSDRRACQPVLRGEEGPTPRRALIRPAAYLERVKNCDCFRSDLGYFVSPEDTTDDERRFPIAFSLLTYNNLEQTERLLRLIYRPHNFYCIHGDAKAPQLRRGLKAIASCLDNVFVAHPPVDVNWGKISIVHAELLCMRQLLQYSTWKYFINLVGRDFPLRTNLELVKILTAYNGSNDVDGSRKLKK